MTGFSLDAKVQSGPKISSQFVFQSFAKKEFRDSDSLPQNPSASSLWWC